jgi:hypothetical protein
LDAVGPIDTGILLGDLDNDADARVSLAFDPVLMARTMLTKLYVIA